jgi:pilus assembly protein CpaE
LKNVDTTSSAPIDLAASAEPSRSRVIVFAHASGGAGATTLAVNAALHLARRGAGTRRVCLLDLDLQFGTVDLQFNLPVRSQLADLAANPERLDEQMLENMMVDGPDGVRVLTAPSTVLPLDIFRPATIGSILEFARRRYDDVVIDLPVALTAWTDMVLNHADKVFLVTQINVIALRTARMLLDTLFVEGLARGSISVVVNRYPAKGHGARITLNRGEEVLGLPVSACIPSDYPSIMESLDYGKPATLTAPHSRFATAVAALLDTMEGDRTSVDVDTAGRGLFSIWRK